LLDTLADYGKFAATNTLYRETNMKTLLALALTTAALSPVAATAGSAVPARSVSIASVDFRDPAALQAFYSRLKIASIDVCDSNSANPVISQRDRLCRQKALDVAVRSINRPTLTALHQAEAAYAQASR
jgi:UrcA family protein